MRSVHPMLLLASNHPRRRATARCGTGAAERVEEQGTHMYMLGVPGHPATPESQTLPYASCFGIVAAAADSAFWQSKAAGSHISTALALA